MNLERQEVTAQCRMETDSHTDHEVEFGVLESGSNLKFDRCQKNPGHKNMSLVRNVSVNDLPEDWRYKDLFLAIMSTSRAVVKITVPYVSPNRPDNYPGGQHRGQWYSAVGSGIAEIYDDICQASNIECPLPHCTLPKMHKTTPVFKVLTSTHVVFDDEEAQHTTVEFFYDSEEDVDQNVVTCNGIRLSRSSKNNDSCSMFCVSHDVDLFTKVRTPPVEALLDSILAPTPPSPQRPKDPLVVIISHPHGHFKHVAFGTLVDYTKHEIPPPDMKMKDLVALIDMGAIKQWKQEYEFISPELIQEMRRLAEKDPEMHTSELFLRDGHSRDFLHYKSITYTTPTCPGSSGAYVWTYLPGQRDKPWVHAGDSYHSKGVRGNLNKGVRPSFRQECAKEVKTAISRLDEIKSRKKT